MKTNVFPKCIEATCFHVINHVNFMFHKAEQYSLDHRNKILHA